MSRLLAHSTVTARKDHKCDYCNQIISKGDKYEKDSMEHEGSVYTWVSHLNCTALASKLRWFDDCDDGLTMDGFIESVNCAWSVIMQNEFTEIYEGKEFRIPPFTEKLEFLIKRYLS